MTDKDLNKLGALMDTKLDKLRREITREIVATRDGLRKEIVDSEDRVIKGILEFISDHVVPIIEDNADKSDVKRIERRLDEIESLPTVAHELKFR